MVSGSAVSSELRERRACTSAGVIQGTAVIAALEGWNMSRGNNWTKFQQSKALTVQPLTNLCAELPIYCEHIMLEIKSKRYSVHPSGPESHLKTEGLGPRENLVLE